MTTSEQTASDIQAWFAGRLPQEWTADTPQITVDREEITVRVTVAGAPLGEDADEAAVSEAAAGRISAWREETRETRMQIAREAQHRFERKVSWGAKVGDHTALFAHIAVPTMTRLRQPQRQVLDTLVEAGVARSRSHALAWCVKLVGQHSDEWLRDLQGAMEQVRTVREKGPAA
ncbi:MAG: hypothetical protein H0U28_00280 [Nocardioidaceae bacterium]|nr:hypothetical protein [Nocardioidaceae bacterium]